MSEALPILTDYDSFDNEGVVNMCPDSDYQCSETETCCNTDDNAVSLFDFTDSLPVCLFITSWNIGQRAFPKSNVIKSPNHSRVSYQNGLKNTKWLA